MSGSRRVHREAGPPLQRPVPAPPKNPPTTRPITQPIGVVASQHVEADEAGKRRGAHKRGRRGHRLPERTVVLVGPMAAGKTSLGKRLARELGIDFVDSDAIFVKRHGVIADFFAEHGEDAFRRLEAEIIAEQLSIPGTRILALGGGAVLRSETRERLKEHHVILLMTTQNAVLRTANIHKRPLLRDDPNAWGRILAERKAFYEEVADVTFRSDRATKEQLTQRASRWVRGRGRTERRRAAQAAPKPSTGESKKEGSV